MLVLSRKAGQRIVLGEVVEITVLQIHGNKVRLGVTAPRHISVNRVEAGKRLQERSRADDTIAKNQT